MRQTLVHPIRYREKVKAAETAVDGLGSELLALWERSAGQTPGGAIQ